MQTTIRSCEAEIELTYKADVDIAERVREALNQTTCRVIILILSQSLGFRFYAFYWPICYILNVDDRF